MRRDIKDQGNLLSKASLWSTCRASEGKMKRSRGEKRRFCDLIEKI
jgi:hypothetical protein